VVDSVEIEIFAKRTPVTGGWQDWVIIYANAVMLAGSYTLHLKILGAGEIISIGLYLQRSELNFH